MPIDSVALVHEPLEVEGLSLGNVQGYGVGSLGVVTANSRRCIFGFTDGHYEKVEKLFEDSPELATQFFDEIAEGKTQAAKKLYDLPITTADDAERAARMWRLGNKRSQIVQIRYSNESKLVAQDYWKNPLTDRKGYANFDDWYKDIFKNDLGDVAPYQAHHIIPIDLLYTNKSLQEILQWAEKNGRLGELNFNGLDNGIMLSIADHSAPHKKFSDQIDFIFSEKISKKGDLGNQFSATKDLLNNVKEQIKTEVINSNKKLNEIIINFQ